MTKLLSLMICLLAVKAIGAMPVSDVDRKDVVPALSVVPLEKGIEKAADAVQTEPILVPEVNQKSGIEGFLKNSEAKQPESLETIEEKKSEFKAQNAEEEKKVEEPKTIETKVAVERKAEEELKVAPSEKHEQAVSAGTEATSVKKVDEIQQPGESAIAVAKGAVTSIADAQSIPTVAVAEIAIESAQAKKIDEPVAVEKRAEEPAKEVAKTEEKPDRVTREAEEAAKHVNEKKAEEEQKPLDKASEKVESVVASVSAIAAEEKPIESPVQVIAENSQPKIEPAVATVAAELPQEPKNEAESKPVAELAATEPVARKAAESDVQVKVQAHTNEAKAETRSPAQENSKVGKEQRSEDAVAPVEVAKVAQVVPQKEIAATVAEESKIVPTAIEKAAKSADELKAEELPQPQEVKDTKTDLPKVAEPELAKTESKAQELNEELLKKEEKKDSSEENSSEEKKERKDDQKLNSEEKDSSEEKKEEQVVASSKTVEPATNAASS